MAKFPYGRRGSGESSVLEPGSLTWARDRIEECTSLAKRHRNGRRYEKAIDYFDKAVELLPPADLNCTRKSAIKRQIIECLCERGEYVAALDVLEKTRNEIGPEARLLSLELGTLHSLASHIHSQLGSYEGAVKECRQALDVFEAHGDDGQASRAYKYLGQIQLLTGDISNAYASFTQSLAAFQKVGDEVEVASVMNRMAHLYFISADWDRCISLLEEAKNLAQKHASMRLVGAITSNLGTIHYMLGNWKISREYQEKGLGIFKDMGDTLAVTRRYVCLGNLHQVKREWAQAHGLYEMARSIAEEKHYRRELALSLEFLGELAFDMDELEQAEAHYLAALRIAREIAPDGDLVNEITRRFAELKVRQGEPRKALSLCQKSWDVSLRLGDRFEEGVVFRVFGTAFSLLGDSGRAREYFSMGIDSLTSLGEKYERAKTLHEAGMFIARTFDDRGSRMESIRYLSQAREIFRDLAADHYLGIVEIELERLRQSFLT
jgi:tetratricopeptide (TPR) repeat protein